jgi:hypothetical protein
MRGIPGNTYPSDLPWTAGRPALTPASLGLEFMTPTRLGSADCETVINGRLPLLSSALVSSWERLRPHRDAAPEPLGVEPKNYDEIVIKSLTLLLSPGKKGVSSGKVIELKITHPTTTPNAENQRK